MIRRPISILLLVLAASSPRPAIACPASAGTFPAGSAAAERLRRRADLAIAGVTWTGLDLCFASHRRAIGGTDTVADVGALDRLVSELGARHDFGDGWAAGVALPIGRLRYRSQAGDISRVSGLGDLRLSGSYELAAAVGWRQRGPSIALGVGVGFPTSDDHAAVGPFVPPRDASLGPGAFSAHASVVATQPLLPTMALSARAAIDQPFSANEENVIMGTRVDYGVGAMWWPAKWLSTRAQLGGTYNQRARDDATGAIANTGGHLWAAEAGVSVHPSRRFAGGVLARVPFFAKRGGTQLTETFSVMTSLAVRFGGEPAATAGPGGHVPDIEDLARGGESFSLEAALVPDKITVFDFWADWCEPCKVVGRSLDVMAVRFPDLAVRRVEVPDFDTDVAQEHLDHAAALPVVWIFDRDGQPLEALEATTASEVEALVLRALER